MNPELLEIQPKELKFTFELKKQSLCSVQLVNNSDEYVAFKVKTTSPKKYSVRPNRGIVLPRSTCDFIVTMQAQRTALADMQCKDKFLIQSTVVPFGTTAEDITPAVFTKENGSFIEENKLRVILVGPSPSPVLLPTNGALRQEPAHEASILTENPATGVENLPPSCTVSSKDVGIPKDMKIVKDIEELNTKRIDLELKLNEAGKTIRSLTEERKAASQERDMLLQELAFVRKKTCVQVHVGYPFLFVCLVALISMVAGYILHP